ncbi:MAG: cell division protein FtsQ/DivIB [Candidatus Omnitrophota bacterium]|jgi:cell division septal protein FtsQ
MAKHRLKKSAFRLILPPAIAVLAVFLFIYFARRVSNLDYFKIKDIMVNGRDSADLAYLKGQNIFRIDIRRESGYLGELYPDFKSIRLIKVFPNRLYVDFIKRKPLAMVKLYRYFCVDSESVLFDCPAEVTERDFPVITGLDTKIFGPKTGTRYNLKELTLALNIIQEASRQRTLKNFQMKRVSVLNPDNVTFFIERTEVKIGGGNLKERMAILGTLLNQSEKGLEGIEYIDLRFKEPVIKLKHAE